MAEVGHFSQCTANYKSTLSLLGYSWLSNEYGLAIDNVEAFELVMPSGEVVNATQSSYQDLFFALKVRQTTYHDHAQRLTSSQGGFNNFVCCTLILFPMCRTDRPKGYCYTVHTEGLSPRTGLGRSYIYLRCLNALTVICRAAPLSTLESSQIRLLQLLQISQQTPRIPRLKLSRRTSMLLV